MGGCCGVACVRLLVMIGVEVVVVVVVVLLLDGVIGVSSKNNGFFTSISLIGCGYEKQ